MIGLFPDKHGQLWMEGYFYTIENGCEYDIYVDRYYEPNAECGSDEIKEVFHSIEVDKTCGGWTESIRLDHGYIEIVAKSLHEEYLKMLEDAGKCGG
jgi:hypothetical protein